MQGLFETFAAPGNARHLETFACKRSVYTIRTNLNPPP